MKMNLLLCYVLPYLFQWTVLIWWLCRLKLSEDLLYIRAHTDAHACWYIPCKFSLASKSKFMTQKICLYDWLFTIYISDWLLTLARVGGVESYCIRSVCLSFSTIPANLRTLALWKYYQQMSNHTRIKSNNRLLLKPFCFKVKTIFVTHSHCFTTFRRPVLAKRVHLNTIHLAWSLSLLNYSLK